MYEESRKLRHDLKQCLTSAIGYMDDNNYDKAEDFLKNIMSEKSTHMLIENTVIIERSTIFLMIRMINVKSRI